MEPKSGIIWDVNPVMLEIGNWSIRWYGLLFALGFVFGIIIFTRMFKNEGIKRELLDSLFLFVVIGTVIGARLGHVFFYDWAYYKENTGEILKIWHGGLASHGGAIGIGLALLWWSKKYSKRPIIWILDRIVVTAALAAACIRTGNLVNSEIIGGPSTLPWAFTFIRVDHIPRHPAQLYEALAYLVLFGVLMYLYWKTDIKEKPGRLFGLFMVLMFGFRFFIEFLKEDQVAFEAGMALNMGQWLSIPLVLLGVFAILWKPKKKAPSGA